ncbi:hypothetical protein BKA65DRAFT_521267 [Rhexocercosporidium sp. MPI-PUGE-AT-0058]|nr:hypothetical protein BKA65DRAFT_521267 [Rhexocercosporidium sp. MPI-PUGE-AT-0058]
METTSEDSTPKRHSRHNSSGRALPRRPTRPGSNLSTLTTPSFRTARTSLSPSRSNMSAITTTSNNITSKDFSFLLRPEIYHPLTLLDVPPPFRVTSSQVSPSTPLATLLSTGHFRAAAIKAASLLASSNPPIDPSDHTQIFELIYARLASLTLCNQTALAAQEVKALEDLNSAYYRDELDGRHLVPWELRVLAVRLQGMGFNDARRGWLTLSGLKKVRKEKKSVSGNGDEAEGKGGDLEAEIELWEQRLADLGIRVASALIEMEDLEGATRFLSSLKPDPRNPSRLAIQKALLWLCIGDVEAARACVVERDRNGKGRNVILALAAMADSEFDKAVEVWRALIEGNGEEGEKAMWRQNLGVCYLYLGRMDEARKILESLISTSHSFHALTFNLSTIYELCTERSRALKIGLAEKVASMLDSSGADAEEARGGWEKVNGDFKL